MAKKRNIEPVERIEPVIVEEKEKTFTEGVEDMRQEVRRSGFEPRGFNPNHATDNDFVMNPWNLGLF